jgi:UPF0716 protein FxsA
VRYVLLFFIAVPLAELFVLTWLSGRVGFWTTVALILVTGALGSVLARREGLKAWHEWQRSLAAGQPPEVGLIEGLLLLVGCALLITPGVLTDAMGLALLLPWSRKPIAKLLKVRVLAYLARGTVFTASTVSSPRGAEIETRGETIDDP